MTSDGDALFRTICEQPWEDTPRLVYADWLDENGQPERAEFIRLQMELAAMPRDKRWGTPQYYRAEELEQKWDPRELAIKRGFAKRPQKSWSADLPKAEGVEWGNVYSRGFRYMVTFSSMKPVRAHADTIMSASPIDDVTVKRLQPPAVVELLALPWIRQLRELRLSGNVGERGVRAIIGANLTRLESLELAGAQITDAGLKLLAGAKSLPNLTRLGLDDNNAGVTEAGLNELMLSKTLTKLTAVDGVRFTLLPNANPLHIFVKFYERFPDSR